MYGFLIGAFSLVVLEVLVANKPAYGAVGGIFNVLAASADHLFDPHVPAIGKRPYGTGGALVPTSSSVMTHQLQPALGQQPTLV